ncbi:MAG: lipopolysaccharide heptosyltransferase II [Flavobacteriaceae bacterium]
MPAAKDNSPILVVPFMWIGDFVRCQSVLQVLRERFPDRAIDVLSSRLCAPLTGLMPEVRETIVADFPRGKLSLGKRRELAGALRARGYGSAYLMLGTFKDALAPWLAGIPERVGWLGEYRYGLLTDIRHGEKQVENLGRRCVLLALPADAPRDAPVPPPRLTVTDAQRAGWKRANGIAGDGRPLLAIAPGCNDPVRTWPIERFAALARLAADDGMRIAVMGGPAEKELAARIAAEAGEAVHDFTGTDLYQAALQAAAADVLAANDSGLLHLGAATGTPAVAIYCGSSHAHTGPLNPDVVPIGSRTRDVSPQEAFAAVQGALKPR